jgi:hypothetical protein
MKVGRGPYQQYGGGCNLNKSYKKLKNVKVLVI